MMIALILACCLAAPPEVSVDSETLTFGSVLPLPASDQRASISLGYAPNPGLARRFTKQDFIARLKAAGAQSDDLQLPESVLVRRASQMLDADIVRKAVTEAFRKQYPDGNTSILSVDVPPIQIGSGMFNVTATLPPRVETTGPVYVKVDIRGENFTRQVFVRTEVRIESTQAVLLAPVAAHSAIRTEDVEWKPAPLNSVSKTVASLNDIAGMVAKRDLTPGETLTTDLLYSPLFVHKGDSVTVKVVFGGIAIAATMRAKASGHFGDTILVEHLSGTGSTTARVVGPGLLEALESR